ncbi:SUMO-activating enzyme subunit 1 [Mus caroli]|uniref:SUMO-activating enzyme subunit 1 n=1 Tax=Mus caroli TaxID=10089 RepID=A0A6P7R3C7_MUSCR|nr:SUMO-activating enzyme subunit 1 [Mus caroli]
MVEKEEAGGGGGGGISEEEAAQYDRQIRLWGLEAQKRLRASRVLIVGMKGLGAEIAKNLILAGVKGLTMLDHEQVSPEDPGAQFLIQTGSVGRNRAEASLERAQNLNPMVDVKVDTEDVEKKPESFFTKFDATRLCLNSAFCSLHSSDVTFKLGFLPSSLSREKTKVAKVSQGVEDGPEAKRAKLDSSETTMVKKKVLFCPVKEALEVDWRGEKAKAALKRTAPDYFLLQVLLKFRTDKGRDPTCDSYEEDAELLLQIRSDVCDSLGLSPDLLPDDFVRYCFSEMAPVCAVVGGILAQEIVKALSQRDPPHNNFFFFDGMKGSGIVECLGPQ